MDSREVKAEFVGLGPITQSKTTHMGGFGISGSFVPMQQDRVKLRSDKNLYQPNGVETLTTYPFHLTVVNVVEAGVNVSKVRIQYGEIDGVPPTGLTLDEDYLLESGNAFIYLIVTFDGDGRISSRTIGFDDPVPADTNDTKHIIIGEVAYVGGLYEIVNQNIAQDIYPEKALVVDRSDGSFVYSLFADPRKINAIYELENFNVNLDGDNLTTTLYLKSEDNAEYLELKKDSGLGASSVYGHAGNEAQNFVVSSDNDASISKLELFDTSSANFITSAIDSTGKSTVRGYSNNEEQNFLIESNSVTGTSEVRLFDSGSANYIESKVDTDVPKSSIYGYADNSAQNFNISADASGVDAAKIALYDSGSVNYIEVKEGLDVVSVYGYMNNQEHNFVLKAQAGESHLRLFNTASECYLEAKATNTESTLYGYSNNQAEYFILKAKAADAQFYLFGDSHYVKIDIPYNGAAALNATWREIDICVEGVAKKMKVLGTTPY